MDNTTPFQEVASTYFNSILRKNVTPVTVDELAPDAVEGLCRQLRLAFGEEAEATIRRVRYLIPYILQSIDWESYGYPLEAWQLRYYYRHERFVAKTHLDYDAFLADEPLQEAITALQLEPEPTFEFILFLKYYYGMRSELRHSPIEQLELAQEALASMTDGSGASIDINVGGKHYVISNAEFVKDLLLKVDAEGLRLRKYSDSFSEGGSRDKIRAIDYYIVKTLLDYLPTHHERSARGRFSQKERNFGLSVLNFLGRLPDVDRVGICSSENNATFDKLMRDFRGVSIPFAMELFL